MKDTKTTVSAYGFNMLAWKCVAVIFVVVCVVQFLIETLVEGLKKFICYNVTPSDTNITVQRRYKHFDWLYARLVERFPIVAIPRLPDKQASGRFEEDFIEGRMARLKLWVGILY